MITGDRSLLSPGILSLICSFCFQEELEQLVFTNKALSTLATRKIWHTLPSFVPLVYTLPPDAWTYWNTEAENSRYCIITQRNFALSRPLVPADFARLRVYAPFVKVIVKPPDIHRKYVISPSIWKSFREHGVGPLFDIRGIQYVSQSPLGTSQHLADPIHDFIGASLVELYFTLQGEKDYDDLIEDPNGLLEASRDPVLLDILAHLSSNCPRLRNLCLEITPFPFYAADALSDAVCRWSHLRSFEAHTCPLRPAALKHLAALPSLRLLDAFIDIPPADLVSILLPHAESPLVFPALRELALHARHLATCTRMLDLIESMALAKISIYAYAHASPEDIEAVFNALATGGSRDTITELLVKPGCTPHSPPSPHGATTAPPGSGALPLILKTQADSLAPPRAHAPLPQTTFHPLLSLSALQKLSLLGPCLASSPHPTTLASMARALPHLYTAALCPDASCPDGRVALADLGALAGFAGLGSVQLSLAEVDGQAVADAFARQRDSRRSSSESRPAGDGISTAPGDESTDDPALPVDPTSTSPPTLTPNPDPDPGPPELDDSSPEPELEPDHEPEHDGSPSPSSLLYCLGIGHARIAESCVEGTAAALSAWFPRLTDTNYSVDPDSDEPVLRAMGFRDGDDAAEVRRQWLRVGELVGAFAAVQEQERRWAVDHLAAA